MNRISLWRAAFFVVGVLAAGFVSAQALQPFQQQALDRILATVDPEIRGMMRAQLEPTLAVLNQAQVAMMLEAMDTDAAAVAASDTGAEAPAPEPIVTAEDLAYNQAQFEPVIRRVWAAQKRFDDFVDARLDQHCGREPEFAVFGAAWRYEVYPLAPTWQRASNNADLDVQIIGGSYAPQDGRYDFDFSEVRFEFDSSAVEQAIATACAEYRTVGEAFLVDARSTSPDDPPEDGMQIEGAANRDVGRIRETLEQTLKAEAPAGNNAVFTALLNGRPAN